ncbi:thermonuclease family protein [Planococcus sp. N028]|uniref:Thermonuclease family protein n=1 Tax=Planococcus shixiaomingii TaxID=3058393 RepID=A0ABT8N151_9BACL|nr:MULTISPECIES: thermonuclease family protein [unclassified Planococcus (in: firmicutes)]MDN7241448.1 thermonuclease family protein [Planococcus sp. N028]WKA53702.1 thermonuclease family protein [Planococcus sp. N022]
MKYIVWIVCLLLLSGCGLVDSTDTSGTTDQIEVEVTSVIDGDTIKIMYEGKEETVRYLLIDTPETNHPSLGEQPLGKEATKENKRIIESGKVSIEFDVGERFDDYGRLLAYIYVDGESVQEQMLESGLARVAYVYPPNTRYVDEFEKSEQQAKDAGIGIWEFEDYSTNRGFNAEAYGTVPAPNEKETDNECDIKGNINRNGNKIYHMPGSGSYEQTNPEKWFCTEQEARDAGFRSAGQ